MSARLESLYHLEQVDFMKDGDIVKGVSKTLDLAIYKPNKLLIERRIKELDK